MRTLARHFGSWSTELRYLVFALGLFLLIGSWIFLYVLISLKTEALLAPWQNGCGWYTCAPFGTMPRTINDFFTGFGRDLPSVIFLLVCVGIFAIRARRSRDKTWLPLVFFLANIVFLAADLLAVSLSWSLSNWVVGPRIPFDNGYHRTWYGIVATCLLWAVFWVLLVRLPIGGATKQQTATPSALAS